MTSQLMTLRYWQLICFFMIIASMAFIMAADESKGDERAATVATGPPLPIWAWHGVPAEFATSERYAELADAGFTVSYNGAGDAATVTKMLDAAQTSGVKLLISCPELQTEPEQTVRRFREHPALAGYYLRDEPSAEAFPELAAWMRRIQAVDDVHPCYVNLLPTYGNPDQWGAPDYATYVQRFIDDVPAPTLSFDHYPVVRTGEDTSSDVIRNDFYENLEICSAAARKSQRPLQAFVLSVAHTPYPVPTLAHLRLQVYSNLAYGAQVIQYFTYWTPVSTVWNFHEAPIEADGVRTPTYDLVQQINAELQAVRCVFVGSVVESVGHTGDAIPAGTMRFEPSAPISSLATQGVGVAAAQLSKGNQRFLVLVNRDIQQPTTASIDFDGSTPIQAVAKDGTLHAIDASSHAMLIAPGDVAILTWSID